MHWRNKNSLLSLKYNKNKTGVQRVAVVICRRYITVLSIIKWTDLSSIFQSDFHITAHKTRQDTPTTHYALETVTVWLLVHH